MIISPPRSRCAPDPTRVVVGVTVTVFAAVLFAWSPPMSARDAGRVARRQLSDSMQAMGGKKLLRSIRGVTFTARAQRNLLEQSIRPEGPWWVDYYRTDVTLDFAGQRAWIREQHPLQVPALALDMPPSPMLDYVVTDGVAAARTDGKFAPTSQAYVQDANEMLAFNPLRLLLTAAAADDLHAMSDTILHGVRQHVLAWTWHGAPVRLYLNSDSQLPSAVQWTTHRPRDIYWHAWGDVNTHISFDNWFLQSDGLRVPVQWSYRRNGLPERNVEIATLDINPKVPTSTWALPAPMVEALRDHTFTIDNLPLGSTKQPAVEIVPGIVQIPGAWNVTLVRQDDGIVVLEAPIGNGYSKQVLEAAAKRFPGMPIKAVITTSDAWPHIAGLREYVARSIPVYLLERNTPIVNRLLAALHTRQPDALQHAPRHATLHAVSTPTMLGHGDNRIALLPLHSAVGERQMLAWFPAHRLLYTSDLVQPIDATHWYAPEMLLELRKVAAREHIAPAKGFGVHYGPTAWKDMLKALTTFLHK